jgi:hypothetical protein
VRFIAESDSESGLGGEVQYAQVFGGSKSESARLSAPAPGHRAGSPGVIASLTLEETTGADLSDVRKKLKIDVGIPSRGVVSSPAWTGSASAS